jgi:hypothetical protein
LTGRVLAQARKGVFSDDEVIVVGNAPGVVANDAPVIEMNERALAVLPGSRSS